MFSQSSIFTLIMGASVTDVKIPTFGLHYFHKMCHMVGLFVKLEKNKCCHTSEQELNVIGKKKWGSMQNVPTKGVNQC